MQSTYKFILKSLGCIDSNQILQDQKNEMSLGTDSLNITKLNQCGICLENTVDMQFYPCKHMACILCLNAINNKAIDNNTRPACHMCRSFIEHATKQELD